jgi:hypothetical protein
MTGHAGDLENERDSLSPAQRILRPRAERELTRR